MDRTETGEMIAEKIWIIPVNRGQIQYVPLVLLYILEFFYPIVLLYYLLDQIQFCHRHIGGSRHPLSFRIDNLFFPVWIDPNANSIRFYQYRNWRKDINYERNYPVLGLLK